MNHLKTILPFLLILSLSVFACSDDNEENVAELSDFPLQGFLDLDTSFMLLAVEERDGDFFSYMRLLITESHEVFSLQIDGNNIEMSAFGIFYIANLDLLPGQEFTYRLRIDDNIRTGTLSIPAVIQGSFPDVFNLSANYSMSWTTSPDPTGFVALLQIELDDDWIDHGDLLSGSARSHTFNSNIYTGLSEDDVWYIDAGVFGMNFDMNDDMLIMAVFDDYEVYLFDDEIDFRLAEKQVAGSQPRGRLPVPLRHLAVPVE